MSDDQPAHTPTPVQPAGGWAAAPAHQIAWGKLIAHRLYQARRHLQVKQGDVFSLRSVSSRLGRSPTWLSNLENGHRRIEVTVLRTLAVVYGVAASDLVSEPSTDDDRSMYDAWVRRAEAAAAESARLDALEEAQRKQQGR